jgi:hypothetical protein
VSAAQYFERAAALHRGAEKEAATGERKRTSIDVPAAAHATDRPSATDHMKVVKPRYCAAEPIEVRSKVPDPIPPSCKVFSPEGSTMPSMTYPAPSVSVLPLPANWMPCRPPS